jgi:hypothetical protein
MIYTISRSKLYALWNRFVPSISSRASLLAGQLPAGLIAPQFYRISAEVKSIARETLRIVRYLRPLMKKQGQTEIDPGVLH